MAIAWPSGLVPRIVSLRPIEQTRSANKSLSGFVQAVDGITFRWGLTLEFNTLKRAQILPYRGLLGSLKGRANAVKVPIFDTRLYPTAAEIVGKTITGTAGDNSATVALAGITGIATALMAGHYFNAGDDLHLITAINFVGTTASIDFVPSLRENKAAAPFLLRPTLICRLTNDASGEHPTELGLRMAPTMDFEEAPDE